MFQMRETSRIVPPVKSPTERGLTAQRLIDVRKAAGYTNQKEAAAHVRKVTGVVGLTDSQWASYESGDSRRPFQQKHREAIESVLGPLGDDRPEVAAPSDMAALLVRLDHQAAAIEALSESVARLAAAVAGQTRSVSEAAADGMTTSVHVAIQSALDSVLSRLPVPPDTQETQPRTPEAAQR